MNLPTPVYEYLPSIYVICGGLLLANFDNGLGKSAAMILIFTGAVESGPAEGNYIWEHGDPVLQQLWERTDAEIEMIKRINGVDVPKTEWRDVPVVLEE